MRSKLLGSDFDYLILIENFSLVYLNSFILFAKELSLSGEYLIYLLDHACNGQYSRVVKGLASEPKGPDSSPETPDFQTDFQTRDKLTLWCPCSPNSIHNWYQLASRLRVEEFLY